MSFMSKKVGMISLGCPKNQVDGEIMLSKLTDNGFEITNDVDGADVVIVNTCGFIEDAKKEAIENILDMVELKKEGVIRKIVVTGCLAERYRDEVLSEIPEVVTDGLVVYPKVVRSRLMAELPFMASENIMMQAVEKGGNRQELHERLRQHAIAAGKQVKEEGLPNDMVDRIAADPAFGLTKEEIVAGLVPENFVGRAPQQVEEFIAHILKPIFDANPDAIEQHASLSV